LLFARDRLSMHPPDKVHPHERPIEIGDARAVVLGMGRIGKATYRELTDAYGVPVLGVENNSSRAAALQEQGFNVVDADATDADFWDRLQLTGSVEIAVLAMPFHGTNLDAFHRLRAASFDGVVAAVAQYEDQMQEMRKAGVDVAVHLYEGVGVALAERAAGAAEDRDF
jgi:Trk K+ transport system NAD-binding subunit